MKSKMVKDSKMQKNIQTEAKLPKHVAIIMDGNGRWATQRHLPRVAGHQQGAESVRAIVGECSKKGIAYLTLYTFSSENWNRPSTEIDFLMSLFLRSLRNETQTLHKNNIRLKIIGNKSDFSTELQQAMQEAEALTENNSGLQVNLALSYGGRWDIVQTTQKLCERVLNGELKPQDITEKLMSETISLNDCPEPDLLIRTSGEYRISNFLIWQIAYTELYFTETHWPDFREAEFEKALNDFAQRHRRFGYTPEQTPNGQELNNNVGKCVSA